MSGDHHDAHPVPDEQRQAEAGLWPRRVSPAPSTPGEPRWECVVPMSVRFRTCTEARSHASCRTYNEHQRADARTPAPPAPLTRPDTDELRATAHFVCDDIDNGRGDDASDLILAAADWIDAQPAPLTPTPQPDGRWVEAIWHILVTEGGANAEDRDAFIAQWPDCVEYRFGGHLGSGGKVWAPGSKRSVPVVDFYPESSTVSRRAIAARINVHLCDAYVMAIALGSAAPPPTPVERPAAITDEMLRAAETHHGDSCSYCTSAGDIDCPTAAILDALTTSPAPGDNP